MTNRKKRALGISSNKTIQKHICDELRGDIRSGKLRSGQQLRQDEIAARFGVSRVPVREALIQLDAEGLVKFSPYKGAVVSAPSSSEVQEIFEIRFILESAALRFAMENITEKDLVQAEEILERTRQEKDPEKWSSLNWEIHSFIYSFARRPKLYEMIDSLHTNINRYLLIYLKLMNHQEDSMNAHHSLIDAFRKKDVEKAVDLLREHLSEASRQICIFLSS